MSEPEVKKTAYCIACGTHIIYKKLTVVLMVDKLDKEGNPKEKTIWMCPLCGSLRVGVNE